MRSKKLLLASLAAITLAITACSSGGKGTNQSGQSSPESGHDNQSATTAADFITINGGEPADPLLPGDTFTSAGGALLTLLWAGLVTYGEKGENSYEIAESIDTHDSQLYTVKLKKGWKFSDHTEIKAHNFVDAWKMTASKKLKQAPFLAPIEGTDDGGTGDLNGVKVIDDYTFSIKLKQPEPSFPDRLVYGAFLPLPDSTLKDPKNGGEHPVGPGPYMLASDKAWEHNKSFTVVPNPEYKGERIANNKGIKVLFYTGLDAAYNDLLAGNLDVLSQIPDKGIKTYQKDLDGRFINDPTSASQSIAIPVFVKHFTGEEGQLRRQAISYAIDRDGITEKIFSKTRTPAKDFTAPPIPGYSDKVAGNEVLTYSPEKAKELWKKADAISPWSGSFTISYNVDRGDQNWVDAVANSIKNTLGIDSEGKSYPDQKAMYADLGAQKISGALRSNWQADYPRKFNFLEPKFRTGSFANDTGYSNPEFDKLLDQSSTAKTPEDANKLLDQAQGILFRDLPAIPLWYSNVTAGWSDRMDQVKFLWNGLPQFWSLKKKSLG